MRGEWGGDADALPISTVSRLLRIPVPTIRSWERRYAFPSPARTDGRHRRYSGAEVDQLRALRDLITNGHSPRTAVDLLHQSGAVRPVAGDLVGTVVEAASTLDSPRLRAALEAAAERIGVEDAIGQVVLPAMREIGSHWRAGRCDVEHEHVATDAVRGWLARQAFLAPPPFRPRPIVLACGPNELHTVGLEAFGVLLARRGWPCRILGAMTPVQALVAAVTALRAAGAVVTAQRSVTRRSAAEALRAIDAIPGIKVFYAGNAFVAPSARRDVGGIYLGADLVEAVAVLESAVADD